MKSIGGTRKLTRLALPVVLVIAVALIMINPFALMEKNSEKKAIQIYREGTVIYSDDKPLLEGVVDYALTSLDGKGNHLLVISEQRSDQIDEEGYLQAVEEGQHKVGGYIRIYKLIYAKDELATQLIYENDFTLVNPWCIDTGYMGDNDRVDIFIGAYRATRYYEADRRPYLLEWTGDYMRRKWTGSYLNMRTYYEAGFEDYTEDGLDELYAVQPKDGGGLEKVYYTWLDFDFAIVGTKPIEESNDNY